MPRDRSFMERLSAAADLEDEPIPGLPLAEIAGDRRVLIEHHFGVTEYSREQIGVKVRFGKLLVCGRMLRLARMTHDQLIICGCIDCVRIIRGRG